MRAEERAAQEWLLYREQCNDLRNQLQAAVDVLVELTTKSRDEINVYLAVRVEQNRQNRQKA